MNDIFFDWSVADMTGWGNYGLNLILNGPANRRPVPLDWPPALANSLDPISAALMTEVGRRSAAATPGSGDFVLIALNAPVPKREIAPGPYAVGVIFAELKPLAASDIAELKRYDRIITGCSWSQDYFAECGVDARLVIQGVNTDLFRPQPKRHFKDRFVVFSGGKLEHRKGQDIVVKAFSHFAERHPEALLVTAWRSPFEQLAVNINASGLCKPLVPEADMAEATRKWVLNNGVRKSQYMYLNVVPNSMMPEVFREVDLAVFTNRCEAGTNLVAMEALSSGVPCLISNNTGHKDIITADNCIALTEQRPLPITNTEDWGESSVDEVVGHMEDVHSGRRRLDRNAIRRSMSGFTWEAAIANLIRELDGLAMERTRPAASTAAAAIGERGEFAHVGRNTPCPCGSGKRFKHCHGLAA